jgi:hypothetical protein
MAIPGDYPKPGWYGTRFSSRGCLFAIAAKDSAPPTGTARAGTKGSHTQHSARFSYPDSYP